MAKKASSAAAKAVKRAKAAQKVERKETKKVLKTKGATSTTSKGKSKSKKANDSDTDDDDLETVLEKVICFVVPQTQPNFAPSVDEKRMGDRTYGHGRACRGTSFSQSERHPYRMPKWKSFMVNRWRILQRRRASCMFYTAWKTLEYYWFTEFSISIMIFSDTHPRRTNGENSSHQPVQGQDQLMLSSHLLQEEGSYFFSVSRLLSLLTVHHNRWLAHHRLNVHSRWRILILASEHISPLSGLLVFWYLDTLMGQNRYQDTPKRSIWAQVSAYHYQRCSHWPFLGWPSGNILSFCLEGFMTLESRVTCSHPFVDIWLLTPCLARYLNDLWVFDTQEYNWTQVEFKETDARPSWALLKNAYVCHSSSVNQTGLAVGSHYCLAPMVLSCTVCLVRWPLTGLSWLGCRWLLQRIRQRQKTCWGHAGRYLVIEVRFPCI